MIPSDPEGLARAVLAGHRPALARAVTWVESGHVGRHMQAQDLLQRLLPHTGRAVRVGISGPPGAGKSTLIEALGGALLDRGHRLAVLAVDPTSVRSGGSLLGDKTRMTRLANDPRAFVRPSPSGGTLGGVHRATREAMLVCEASGFDVVLVETVGVGQSELAVSELVDTLVLLALPGAGDEVQGIKRGILEVADIVAITKADGDQAELARQAQHQLSAALRLLRPAVDGWAVPVHAMSALHNDGIDALWSLVLAHREHARKTGAFDARRAEQRVRWMWSTVESELLRRLHDHPAVQEVVARCEPAVRRGEVSATAAAWEVLQASLSPR